MDEIERLEIRIEELREAIARSRRLRLVGLASAVIGPALIVGFVLGLVDYSPTRVIVAFALAIGGMVLMGSSRSSTEELERALKQAEAERMAAIDALDLVQVGDGKGSATTSLVAPPRPLKLRVRRMLAEIERGGGRM
jgi:hypothetical protein